MHFWILDEAMLGKRVAAYLDDENNDKWTALHDLSYEEWCRQDARRQKMIDELPKADGALPG